MKFVLQDGCVGVVYIFTNPSFPEYVKIGYADNVKNRLDNLNHSECIPYAFRAYAVYEVKERLKDKNVHDLIDTLDDNLRTIEEFDGKKRAREFYAISAEKAYDILETIALISGTTDRLHMMKPEGHEILDEQHAEQIQNKHHYTEQDHLIKGSTETQDLYAKLRSAMLELGDVSVEPQKLYIAFKSNSNFTDIEVQSNRLKIYLNMKKGTLDDPKGFTQDVSEIGKWGNGDYRMYVDVTSDFDYVISLIKQSYEANRNP